jgi:hypothetical protein
MTSKHAMGRKMSGWLVGLPPCCGQRVHQCTLGSGPRQTHESAISLGSSLSRAFLVFTNGTVTVFFLSTSLNYVFLILLMNTTVVHFKIIST